MSRCLIRESINMHESSNYSHRRKKYWYIKIHNSYGDILFLFLIMQYYSYFDSFIDFYFIRATTIAVAKCTNKIILYFRSNNNVFAFILYYVLGHMSRCLIRESIHNTHTLEFELQPTAKKVYGHPKSKIIMVTIYIFDSYLVWPMQDY